MIIGIILRLILINTLLIYAIKFDQRPPLANHGGVDTGRSKKLPRTWIARAKYPHSESFINRVNPFDLLTRIENASTTEDETALIQTPHDSISTSPTMDANISYIFPSSRQSTSSLLLDVKDVSIWLGDRILFDNVSFRLNGGECVGVIGNNGTGKTSLFDVLYNRLTGGGTVNPMMSSSMDVKYNVKGAADNITSNASMYRKLLHYTSRNERVCENIESLDEESVGMGEHVDKIRGIGYMRQDYMQDLDPEFTVSELISQVFEMYEMCNRVMSFIETNLGTLNEFANEKNMLIYKEILMLYNNENETIKSRFKDITQLTDRLVSMFGMEHVLEDTVKTLSGGYKMRVYLLLLLLHSPNLLLLDEPTNNLDVTTKQFLIDILQYLMNSCGLSILLISHDVNLLNSLSSSILQVTGDGNLQPFNGNFDTFVTNASTQRMIKDTKIDKLKKMINKTTKELNEILNSNKGSQKARKVIISQKQELLDGYNNQLQSLTGNPISKYTRAYDEVLFNNVNDMKRLANNPLLSTSSLYQDPGPIFSLENVSVDGVFNNLNLLINSGERMILLGNNGIGKSTLLNLLKNAKKLTPISFMENIMDLSTYVGTSSLQEVNKGEPPAGENEVTQSEESPLTPTESMPPGNLKTLVKNHFTEEASSRVSSGEITTKMGLSVNYYSQNCTDILDYDGTVYNLVYDIVRGNKMLEELEDKVIYNYMSCFYLSDYMETLVGELSFGERSRLLLSLLFLKKSHYLLLDEPTNHLDLYMKSVLKGLLNDTYKGGYTLVTHDLDFIKGLQNIDTFIYIYSPNNIFTFNHEFLSPFIEFKATHPNYNEEQLYSFLSNINRNAFYQRNYTPKNRPQKSPLELQRELKRKKSFGGSNKSTRCKIKNIKRWN